MIVSGSWKGVDGKYDPVADFVTGDSGAHRQSNCCCHRHFFLWTEKERKEIAEGTSKFQRAGSECGHDVHLSGIGGGWASSGLGSGDVPGGEKGPQRKEIGVQPGKPEFG